MIDRNQTKKYQKFHIDFKYNLIRNLQSINKMNEILNYYVNTFSYKTLSLKKKGILVDKPWALVDSDGEIQKLIFKRDKSLILSKNGKVKEGKWDYFPEAMALLIDRVDDKLLLKEQFIDENVLILKMDGTNNQFFALSNENTITDYDILKYLNSLKNIEFKILEVKILGDRTFQIYHALYGDTDRNNIFFMGKEIVELDNSYITKKIENGSYVTNSKKNTIYVKDGIIDKFTINLVYKLLDGRDFVIEDGKGYAMTSNINKEVKINGAKVIESKLTDDSNYVYEIKDGRISKIMVIVEYILKNGSTIKIEQNNFSKISKGDVIVDSKPIFPLPDGIYRIKGTLKNIKVENNIIK